MTDEIWVLGATGRTGRAVATRLHKAGTPVVLVGRDRERLGRVAAELGGAPRLVMGSLDPVLSGLGTDAPAVVVNTIGPFTATALKVARACPPGTHYVDVANELPASEQILDLDREAADTDRVLVTGAGFGVLATESVVLRLCQGQPPPSHVRVDAVASVAIDAGVIGTALAGTIVEAVAFGGRQIRQGRLVASRPATVPLRLRTPDGDEVTSASGASGELLAAWHACKADSVVAASSLAPTGVAARLLPAISALLRVPGIDGIATRGLARVPLKAQDRPRTSSWAHARAAWRSGAAREGWLRAGDAMDFTSAVAAEVAQRLARGEGRPGAHTQAGCSDQH